MEEKLTVDRPVIVEGKYDKIRLESVIEGTIITTEGFGIFRDAEKKALIRRLAAPNGLIVLTDSDGGGLVIRNYLKSILPKDKLIHLYIPEIKGREKRKHADSKAGFLGVEGIDCAFLTEIFKPYAVKGKRPVSQRRITKTDLFDDGLSGGDGSADRRKRLCKVAGLPANISANAMLEALNLLYDYDGYKVLIGKINMYNRKDAGDGMPAGDGHEVG